MELILFMYFKLLWNSDKQADVSVTLQIWLSVVIVLRDLSLSRPLWVLVSILRRSSKEVSESSSEKGTTPKITFWKNVDNGEVLVHFSPKCWYLHLHYTSENEREIKRFCMPFQLWEAFGVLLKSVSEQTKKPWRSTCPRCTEKYSLMRNFALIINKALLDLQTNQVAFPIGLLISRSLS